MLRPVPWMRGERFAVSTSDQIPYSGRVSANVFRHQYRVPYADCTLGNHVYYARYLDLLESVRGEFFRHLGMTLLQWQERDTIFPVIEARLRYKAPARYDDVLATEVWVTAAERIRLNFAYRVVNQTGSLVLEAETMHVCSAINEKPQRLPAELVAALQPYVRAVQLQTR
jgi:acyl-CoA thioester hydrolase